MNIFDSNFKGSETIIVSIKLQSNESEIKTVYSPDDKLLIITILPNDPPLGPIQE